MCVFCPSPFHPGALVPLMGGRCDKPALLCCFPSTCVTDRECTVGLPMRCQCNATALNLAFPVPDLSLLYETEVWLSLPTMYLLVCSHPASQKVISMAALYLWEKPTSFLNVRCECVQPCSAQSTRCPAVPARTASSPPLIVRRAHSFARVWRLLSLFRAPSLLSSLL